MKTIMFVYSILAVCFLFFFSCASFLERDVIYTTCKPYRKNFLSYNCTEKVTTCGYMVNYQTYFEVIDEDTGVIGPMCNLKRTNCHCSTPDDIFYDIYPKDDSICHDLVDKDSAFFNSIDMKLSFSCWRNIYTNTFDYSSKHIHPYILAATLFFGIFFMIMAFLIFLALYYVQCRLAIKRRRQVHDTAIPLELIEP